MKKLFAAVIFLFLFTSNGYAQPPPFKVHDLEAAGNVIATGTVFATGTITSNATGSFATGTFNYIEMSGDVMPDVSGDYNLGAKDFRWNKVWVSESSIELGDISLVDRNECLATTDFTSLGQGGGQSGKIKLATGTAPTAHAESGFIQLYAQDDRPYYMESDATEHEMATFESNGDLDMNNRNIDNALSLDVGSGGMFVDQGAFITLDAGTDTVTLSYDGTNTTLESTHFVIDGPDAGASTTYLYGGDTAGDDFTIRVNSVDTYPRIQMLGNHNLSLFGAAGRAVNIGVGGTYFMKVADAEVIVETSGLYSGYAFHVNGNRFHVDTESLVGLTGGELTTGNAIVVETDPAVLTTGRAFTWTSTGTEVFAIYDNGSIAASGTITADGGATFASATFSGAMEVDGVADFNSALDMNSNSINNVATPTEYHHAVNKGYLDNNLWASSTSSEGISMTTSDTYQQKVRLSITAPVVGDYIVSWYAEGMTNKEKKCGQTMRLQQDDSADIGEHEMGVADADFKNVWSRSFTGFKIVALDTGSHYFDLDWKSNGMDQLSIRRARIALKKF